MAFDQGRNVAVLRRGQQIAFPMARYRPIFNRRRPLPDRHHIRDFLVSVAGQNYTPGAADRTLPAKMLTPMGRIDKQMRFSGSERRIDFDISFDWEDWGKGVLRLGHFTLLPNAFSLDRLRLSTTNGGGRESFALAGRAIDHGAPVSFLVSSGHGLGMTEGWAEIGDDRTRLRIEVDRSTAPLLGMLTHRPARRSDGSAGLFCQLKLSALELDDTRKPSNYRDGPRRFRFSVLGI